MTIEQLRADLKKYQNCLTEAVKSNDLEKMAEYTNKADEILNSIKIVENAEKMQNQLNSTVVNPAKPVSVSTKIENKGEVVEFFNIVKTAKTNPIQFANVMSATGNEMVMPEDLVKEIRERRIADGSLEDEITWEYPIAKTGSRTIELEGDDDGLVDLDEDSDSEIAEATAPKFKAVKFAKKTKAGILKVNNSLLEDSVDSLQKFVIKTLAVKGKKSLRKAILTVLDTFTSKEAETIDDLKKIVEVDLDPIYLEGAKIIMGQEAYNFISSIKDADGKYLMQPDLTKPGVKTLFDLEVKVLSKKVLKGGKIYIGNLKEGIYGFGDKDIKLAVSDQAGFTKNQTIFRAIERFDIVKAFDDAVFAVNFNINPVELMSKKRK